MVRHHWSGVRRRAAAPLAGLLAFGATTLGFAAPASAQTAEASGAYGYAATDIILFKGPQTPIGPAPVVTLPDGGSATPVTASAPSADASYGPGILFTSGPLEVSTQGTTGSSGSVTSKAKATTIPTQGSGEILYAGNVESTCTASGTGTTGSATFAGPGDGGRTGATLRTSEGANLDSPADDVYYDIPANPPPNTEVSGALEGVKDTFRVVFNEQVSNGDGSITVNAVHEFLLGPTLTGNVIVAHSSCNLAGASAPTTAPPDTSTPGAGTGSGTTGTGSTTGSGTANMPTTGTNVMPLVFIGLELVGAGAIAMHWAKRRRVWPLR